jgi:hypothetical protein
MNLFPKQIKIILLLASLIILPQLIAAENNSILEATANNPPLWKDLTFEGSKLLTTITVKMHLGSGDLSPDDPAAKAGTLLPGCSENDNYSRLLSIKSSTKGLISQGQHDEQIWFKEPEGLPYKRIRMRNDDNPWIKSYCWEKNGVRRFEVQPAGSVEKKQPPSKWTERNEHFYEYPIESADCSSIFEPSLIFYILSTLDPDNQKKSIEICVFGRKQLHRLTMQQVKSSPIDVSFKLQNPNRTESINRQFTSLVYSIQTEPLPPKNKEPENFSLFGLNKNIRIFMDPEKMIPLRVSGSNNIFGEIKLELQNVRLN